MLRQLILVTSAVAIPLAVCAHAQLPANDMESLQQAYVKASNVDVDDHFGADVAISGDTAVVAARLEASAAVGVNGDQGDDSAEAAGAVHVFVRSGSGWVQQAYLKASDTAGSDFFGESVGDLVALSNALQATTP